MFALWDRLRGKKTYLLSAICMAIVLLRTWSQHLEGTPIDWNQVMQQLVACLATMALRHGVAQNHNGNGQSDTWQPVSPGSGNRR